jgi:L-alanine-DL-glutamate epimerase-like enolase superfamily enzyme
MKVTDLTITLHNWDVPTTTYSDQAGGLKQVGVVAIKTDEGVEGHSFLGSAFQGADEFAAQVLTRLKPLVVGRDPLDIGAIWQDLWSPNRRVAAAPWLILQSA